MLVGDGVGFTVIDNDVLDNEELNIQEQSVLIALISYYNKEKGYAYPSYKQLKIRSKLKDNRTLIKTVDSLVEKGYLTKETLKGIGVKYYITKCKNKPSGELHLVENYTKCKNTPSPSGELHQDLVENYTTTNTKTNTKTNTNNIYSDFIKEIISLYPGKKIKSVRDKKLPKLIKQYSEEQIKRCVLRYSKECKGKEKQYILNESTFWNGRYMDYLDKEEPYHKKERKKINFKNYDDF